MMPIITKMDNSLKLCAGDEIHRVREVAAESSGVRILHDMGKSFSSQ